MYIQEGIMRVAKWGSSLAIRLPAEIVKLLQLKEGDDITVHVKGGREVDVEKSPDREELLKRLRALRRPLPPGFKFDRDEANER
jgi:antitoxin MazE